jgi:acid phosphatase
VIVDVDETVLDNSPYQARLVRNGGEYDEASWRAWAEERRARAVPGALAFAQAAAARGITVLYISNRAVALDRATLDNLRALGFPVHDDGAFMGLGTQVPGCQSQGSDKTCRRRWASRHYRILVQVGDQLVDFVQVPDNTPAARDAIERRYRDWFGERWFALPNPSYGGWEAAVFDNAWRLPREQRRQAKRDALDTAN